jgi:uncharacterized protein (DUF362 family)
VGEERVSRRDFIVRTAAAGAALALGRGLGSAAEAGEKSMVVRVRRPKAFSEGDVPTKTVADMVHAAVKRLAGADDLGKAWGSFVRPDDVVGLKINCLFGFGASTHPEVVAAIVAGCKAAGVPDEHILVWDRASADLTKSGYDIRRTGPGYLCYGTDDDYETEAVTSGKYKGHLTKILTQKITALINVPILKTHNVCALTMSMKNHFGTIDNPADCHPNFCDPGVADVNAIPAIRQKTRLIICDALYPIAQGGPAAKPGYTWPYGGIMASRDTVAIDHIGLQILEARRKEIGLGPITREAHYIVTAAARGLGTNDMAKIDLVDV